MTAVETEAATALLNSLKEGARLKVRHNYHTLDRFEGNDGIWKPYGSPNEVTSRRIATILLDEWAGRVERIAEVIEGARLRLAQKKLSAQQAYMATLGQRRAYLVNELDEIDEALKLGAPVLLNLTLEAQKR